MAATQRPPEEQQRQAPAGAAGPAAGRGVAKEASAPAPPPPQQQPPQQQPPQQPPSKPPAPQQPPPQAQQQQGAMARVGAGVEAVGETVEGVGEGVVAQVLYQLASWTWWLLATLPYEVAVRTGAVAWGVGAQLGSGGLQALRWLTVSSAVPITNLSDAAYRYILAALQRCNTAIDGLVQHTPRLIRETMGSAVAAREGKQRMQGMPEETDVAREADAALHRVFRTGEEGRDAEATLLAEARLMVWHGWLLLGLQLTALRSLASALEGMAAWTARAWAQLATALAVLGAMACLAPLAAGAAGVAWASHFTLKQILSLRMYEEAVRSYWAPPLHTVVSSIRGMAMPYLALPQEAPAEPGPEALQREEGAPAAAEEEEGELGLLESAVRLVAWAGSSVWGWLGAGARGARARAVAGLDAAEAGAARLVPPPATEKVEGAPPVRAGPEAELASAADSAHEAWLRASSLAAAAGWTLLDAGRALVIAAAQKFEVPLPDWLLASQSAQALSQDASVSDFNVAAGKAAGRVGAPPAAPAQPQQAKQEGQPQQAKQAEKREAGQGPGNAAAGAAKQWLSFATQRKAERGEAAASEGK